MDYSDRRTRNTDVIKQMLNKYREYLMAEENAARRLLKRGAKNESLLHISKK